MIKVFVYALVVFLGLVIYVRFIEGTSIFLPSRQMSGTPADINLPFEDVTFLTQDSVKINAWLIKSGINALSQPTLLFFHGNAGNLSHRLDKIQIFNALRLNVFIVDYRGYGKSEGRPNEQGVYLDAQAAFDYLVNRKDLAADKIVAYGESLGGTVAVDLAIHRPIAALILDSTFTSAAQMSKKIFPIIPTFLLSVKMDSIGKIASIEVPKLIIHSQDDEIVPYDFGQQLYAAALNPKMFLKISGDHNEGFLAAQNVYAKGISNFLAANDLMSQTK